MSDSSRLRRLKFGMWLFLSTETLIFGGFFLLYSWNRSHQEAGFAIGSYKMDFWLGAVNTLVLLTSSLAIAIAVERAKARKYALSAVWILGALFLALKALEYKHHYDDGLFPGFKFTYAGDFASQVDSFMSLYFLGTGLHAVHMIIGLGLVAFAFLRRRDDHVVELVGLYWHFIDIVWIFLFPAFYLIGSRG